MLYTCSCTGARRQHACSEVKRRAWCIPMFRSAEHCNVWNLNPSAFDSAAPQPYLWRMIILTAEPLYQGTFLSRDPSSSLFEKWPALLLRDGSSPFRSKTYSKFLKRAPQSRPNRNKVLGLRGRKVYCRTRSSVQSECLHKRRAL